MAKRRETRDFIAFNILPGWISKQGSRGERSEVVVSPEQADLVRQAIDDCFDYCFGRCEWRSVQTMVARPDQFGKFVVRLAEILPWVQLRAFSAELLKHPPAPIDVTGNK